MNRTMFVVGILIAVTSASLFVFVGAEEVGGVPIVLCIIGIFFIGASKFRIMNT
jgi:hypothetical protein